MSTTVSTTGDGSAIAFESFQPPQLSAPYELDDAPAGDRRDGLGYVFHNPRMRRSIDVALATDRPLLVSGLSGSGKSSLAPSVANIKGWRFYEHVISSRTQARDLLWTFDTLRRLSDAELRLLQSGGPAETARYISPGELWWAIDPDSARLRGLSQSHPAVTLAKDPNKNQQATPGARAVVLLDEIDKAEPDVPNDLLVPLGSHQFRVQEPDLEALISTKKGGPPPALVIITTNRERELPPAFVRRCILLELAPPGPAQLIEIATQRRGSNPQRVTIYTRLAQFMEEPPKPAGSDQAIAPQPVVVQPSTAEYLDAVDACLKLGVEPDRQDGTWRDIESLVLWKPRETVRTT